jgi:hypothetical protein
MSENRHPSPPPPQLERVTIQPAQVINPRLKVVMRRQAFPPHRSSSTGGVSLPSIEKNLTEEKPIDGAGLAHRGRGQQPNERPGNPVYIGNNSSGRQGQLRCNLCRFWRRKV